jgi:hypothetical protein
MDFISAMIDSPAHRNKEWLSSLIHAFWRSWRVIVNYSTQMHQTTRVNPQMHQTTRVNPDLTWSSLKRRDQQFANNHLERKCILKTDILWQVDRFWVITFPTICRDLSGGWVSVMLRRILGVLAIKVPYIIFPKVCKLHVGQWMCDHYNLARPSPWSLQWPWIFPLTSLPSICLTVCMTTSDRLLRNDTHDIRVASCLHDLKIWCNFIQRQGS